MQMKDWTKTRYDANVLEWCLRDVDSSVLLSGLFLVCVIWKHLNLLRFQPICESLIWSFSHSQCPRSDMNWKKKVLVKSWPFVHANSFHQQSDARYPGVTWSFLRNGAWEVTTYFKSLQSSNISKISVSDFILTAVLTDGFISWDTMTFNVKAMTKFCIGPALVKLI